MTGALDDPSFRQHGEALRSGFAAHDLQTPSAGRRDGFGGLRPLVALICEHGLDEGKAPPRALVEHQRGAVAILQIGGVDHDAQHQAERVDEHMALDALGLLARVKARFLRFAPPFSADLTVWLSTIAALGWGTRSSASRRAA